MGHWVLWPLSRIPVTGSSRSSSPRRVCQDRREDPIEDVRQVLVLEWRGSSSILRFCHPWIQMNIHYKFGQLGAQLHHRKLKLTPIRNVKFLMKIKRWCAFQSRCEFSIEVVFKSANYASHLHLASKTKRRRSMHLSPEEQLKRSASAGCLNSWDLHRRGTIDSLIS